MIRRCGWETRMVEELGEQGGGAEGGVGDREEGGRYLCARGACRRLQVTSPSTRSRPPHCAPARGLPPLSLRRALRAIAAGACQLVGTLRLVTTPPREDCLAPLRRVH